MSATEQEDFEAAIADLSQRDEESFDKPYPDDDLNAMYGVWQFARRNLPDRSSIIEECARVCDARYMGDNNREDMEAKRCAEAIRNLNQSAGEK